MKIKKIAQVSLAFLVSTSSLLAITVPRVDALNLNCQWTDLSLSVGNLMSDSSNWANCGGQAPGAIGGDTYDLTFPAAAGIDPVNDISNLSVGTITFQGDLSTYGSGYDITSSGGGGTQSISVSSGIIDNTTGNKTNKIELGISISGSPTIQSSGTSTLQIGDGTDAIAIGANSLTLSDVNIVSPLTGSGALTINDPHYPSDVSGVDLQTASPGYSGSVSVTKGALFVDDTNALSAASSVTVSSSALLKGNGGISNGIIDTGASLAPGHSPGCISANSMNISGTYTAQIGGTTACTQYDQLSVSSGVNLTGSTLQLSLVNGFTPTLGESFTIIHDTGSKAGGAFTNLASEGSTITVNGILFAVSYAGNGANDVTLTVVNPQSANGSGSSSIPASKVKAPNTGLASDTSQSYIVLSSILTVIYILLTAVAIRNRSIKR